MNYKLIQKLRDGEIGVSNSDYPVIEILEYAFPKSKTKINDLCGFHNPAIGFKASKDLKGSFNAIYVGELYTMPIYSAYTFMQDSEECAGEHKFNNGDLVMANVWTEPDCRDWRECIYIGCNTKLGDNHVVEVIGWMSQFKLTEVDNCNIRSLKEIEVTMQEVADKFGVSVEQIKIKK